MRRMWPVLIAFCGCVGARAADLYQVSPLRKTDPVPRVRPVPLTAGSASLLLVFQVAPPRTDLRAASGQPCDSSLSQVTNARVILRPAGAQVAMPPMGYMDGGTLRVDSIAPGNYAVEVIALGFHRARGRWIARARRGDTLMVRFTRVPMCLDAVLPLVGPLRRASDSWALAPRRWEKR